MFDYRVSNIKGGFYYKPNHDLPIKKLELPETTGFKVKHYHNFTTVKRRFVFIIYWSSNYANFTKVKCFEDIPLVLAEFREINGSSEIKDSLLYHNIYAFGRVGITKRLHELFEELSGMRDGFKAIFSQSHFPGLILKNSHGTFTLYQSGSFSLQGFKDLNSIEHTKTQLCALIGKAL